MNASARRVAVLGGIRIPFARRRTVREGLKPGHVDRHSRRAGVEVRARGRGAGRRGGRVRDAEDARARGITLQEFDFYEIHEAFAAQVLCTLKAWEDPVFCRERLGLDEPVGAIDRDRLNVHGGSLGAGHPFGATGGRIVATLAKELSETDPARPGVA